MKCTFKLNYLQNILVALIVLLRSILTAFPGSLSYLSTGRRKPWEQGTLYQFNKTLAI